MKEQEKHRLAFEVYYKAWVGSNKQSDGLAAVMKTCKISSRTAYRWLESFKWDEKVVERDKEINRRVEEITETTMAENKATYLDYLHGLLNTAVEDIKSGDLKIKSAFELKEIIKVCLLLQDEPTEIVKINIDSKEVIEEELKEYGDVFELVAIEDEVTTINKRSG